MDVDLKMKEEEKTVQLSDPFQGVLNISMRTLLTRAGYHISFFPYTIFKIESEFTRMLTLYYEENFNYRTHKMAG